MKHIKIFDTTLRDGEQAPGCSMHLDEKIEIAKSHEKMGVDVIEAGFAISSKGDFESVETVAKIIKNSTVCSLARCVDKDIDAAYDAVKKAVSPRIHTFLATSPIHMEYKLKMSPESVLERIDQKVRYARKFVSDVEFSCEDATRSDLDFLVKAVYTAINAGASTINIPDTVGYTTPSEMAARIRYLKENVSNIDKAILSVHCHNDLGMAVANSLAGVEAGALQVECTVNGLGERAGNAALEEIVMAIKTRKEHYKGETRLDTTRIYKTSKLVYNTIGQIAPLNKAIVGGNAFLHESGIHQHGMLQKRETYEIMTPESIGLVTSTMAFGKHSGKHAIEERLLELGHSLSKEEMEEFFERFKALADKKKTINDHDIEALLVHKGNEEKTGNFRLHKFTVNSGNYITSSAVVTLKKGEDKIQEVAIGDGPIDASFKAIDKMIPYPERSLDDYIIQSITEGQDALGDVIVKLKSGGKIVTGRGLSTDIIEASILAYINGVNKLTEE